MILALLIIIVGIFLFCIKQKVKNIAVDERTKKITTLLNKFLLVVPFIGIVLFTILLTTVLRGRFLERSSHALIVLALWMLVTSFYVDMLKYRKDKVIRMFLVIGCVISVALVIILTPLDRYNTMLYSQVHEYSYILGAFLLASFYVSNLNVRKNLI